MTTIKVRPNTSSPFVTLGVAPTMAYTTDLGAVTGGSPVTVTHNLGTYDVAVQIVEKGTAGAGAAAGTLVDATVELTSVNALTVTFTSNAAANLYRVTVLAVGATGSGIPTSLIDAKGDLIVGSAADTAARLAVGADNYFLQALASESTGTKWGGAFTAYTPTLTGFTKGNGTTTGGYLEIGKMVLFWAQFQFGTTSAAASDVPTFTLPYTMANPGNFYGKYIDFGTNTYFTYPIATGATTVSCYRISGTNQAVAACTTTLPFTWAVNDVVQVFGIYERT